MPQPENAAEQELSDFLVIAQMMAQKKQRSDFAKAKMRTLPSIVPYSIFDVPLF